MYFPRGLRAGAELRGQVTESNESNRESKHDPGLFDRAALAPHSHANEGEVLKS